MPRRGIFRRIAETVGKIFRPEPPSRPIPPPEPPPPAPGPGGGDTGRAGEFWDTWNDTVSERDLTEIQDRTGYSEQEMFQAHFEIIKSLDPEADDNTLNDMWQDYLSSFVAGDMTHDVFFEIWNIDPRDFDWEAWRDVMGYSRR